jgi:hypothetical protein
VKISDRILIALKTLKHNKKDWMQILLFSFTILMLLISLTAYYSYQRFGRIMLEDGISAHKIRIYGIDETNNELLNQIKTIKNVKIVKKEYETYIRAYANMTMLEFHSIPKEMKFIDEKITSLDVGQMIVSDELELEVSEKKYKGKELIGKWISITIDGSKVKKVKVIDSVDSSSYGIGKEAAFLSENDMIKIADIQKKLLDEYTTIDDIYVLFVEDSSDLQEVFKNIQELGINVDYMVSADSNAIRTIYSNIFIIFLISVFLFFGVKFLYLNSYYNKEKNNISIYLACGYSYNELYKIYNIKNILCSIISFVVTLILYVTGIMIYTKAKEDLVSMGLKAVLPWYYILSVFIVEILVNYIITKNYFFNAKKKEISEFIRND